MKTRDQQVVEKRQTEGRRMLELFGVPGAVAFAQGKSFDEARAQHATKLAPSIKRGMRAGLSRGLSTFAAHFQDRI